MIRLEPYFGRLFSAVLVVLTVIMVIAGVGYVLTVPLSNVADQVAGYSENIGNKLAALEQSTPPWVQHVPDAVSDVLRRVQKAAPSQHNPRTVIALPSLPSLTDNLKPVFPILDAIDLLTAQIVEPLIIGPRIDVSPVVLLTSATYWSWLCGLPGLL